MDKTEESKGKTSATTIDLKVLLCQLNAKMRDIAHNQERVAKSLENYSDKDKIDVVLFPEMVFTGYNFTDPADIEKYCEEAGKGPTFEFLSKIASNLKAYVMCGYPEIFYDEKDGKKKHLYNSMYVIDREGKLKVNYRKHHLYETDEYWAEEGESFKAIELENTKGVKYKAALAICMDINPRKFLDPSKFELAEFCKQERIDAVFMSCAWLDSDVTRNDREAIEDTIDYWLYRLFPLVNTPKKVQYDKKWAFFCANRVGKEGEKCVFTGSSCAVKVNPAELIYALDKRKEGFIVAEVSI